MTENSVKYKVIFFDLDRTLWDFETNSSEALYEMYEDFQLKKYGVNNFHHFLQVYRETNERYWEQYRIGGITKEYLRVVRYADTLQYFGVDHPKLAVRLGEAYVEISPRKKKLVPGTEEVLELLKSKGYQLFVITNGFEEVQRIKLSNCGIQHYFEALITSERAGVKKPNRKIFDYALKLAETIPQASLMVGDDLQADILGAKSVSMDQVYYNPNKIKHQEEITYEISRLSEIEGLGL